VEADRFQAVLEQVARQGIGILIVYGAQRGSLKPDCVYAGQEALSGYTL
jgi:hypothetical protein